MIIDISRLRNGNDENILVDEKLTVEKEIMEKANVIDVKDVHVKGYISVDSLNDYYLDLMVDGTLVLPCSITLEPVDYKFNTTIEGNYVDLMSEIENFNQKIENSLDIFPIIWENILMEIPIKVTCPDATDLKLSGDGWKLVTDGEEESQTSAFDKLKDLL